MRIERYGNTKHWAVYASDGALIRITAYRKGAVEVVRCLKQALAAVQQWQSTNGPTQEM